MESEFNERQFEFAILREFSLEHPTCVPFLPTQIEEYSLGFDAAVKSSKGLPIIYQFKRGNYIKTVGKYSSLFYKNYYFFTTYPGPIESNQHNILKALSKLYRKVFYVAPCFYERKAFDAYYKNNTVSNHSRFIYVSELDDINDTDSHTICYTNASKRILMKSKLFYADDAAMSIEELNRSLAISLDSKDEIVSFESFAEKCKRELKLDSDTNLIEFFNKNGITLIWLTK